MNKPFVLGLMWLIVGVFALWSYFLDPSMIITVLTLNGTLHLVYVVLFYKPYREKQRDILQPALLLITLQLLIFFFATGIYWFYALPFTALFWAMIVFLGVLILQVREQLMHLKSV